MNIYEAEDYRQRFRTTESIQFDLSGQVSGMYKVLIEVEGQRVVKKLIFDRN